MHEIKDNYITKEIIFETARLLSVKLKWYFVCPLTLLSGLAA